MILSPEEVEPLGVRGGVPAELGGLMDPVEPKLEVRTLNSG